MARVAIVAAYAAVRAGLRVLLADAPGITVAGEAAGGEDLAVLLADPGAEVTLFDYSESAAPRVLDLAATGGLGLVMLGEDPDGYRILLEYPLRGWAYLLRDAGAAELAGAIAAADAGLVALDRGLAHFTTERSAGTVTRDAVGVPEAHDETLTPREREVLQLMALGLPNKTIGARLGISLHTVKFHVASILSKLGAASRTEAVMLGAQRGDLAL